MTNNAKSNTVKTDDDFESKKMMLRRWKISKIVVKFTETIYSHGGSDINLEQTGFYLGGVLGSPGVVPEFITDDEVRGKIHNPNLVIVAGACCGAGQDNRFAKAAGSKYYIGKAGPISIPDAVNILKYGVEMLNNNNNNVSEIKQKALYGVTIYP